jgi:hypothetical protein
MPIDITIATHVTTYAPWEDGADEREQTDTSSSTEQVTVSDLTDRNLSEFITLRLNECTENSYGLARVDDYPRADARMYYSGRYEHLYTGELTETSVHISGADWNDNTAAMAFIEWTS